MVEEKEGMGDHAATAALLELQELADDAMLSA
jgi:hypothetical protein